MNKVFYKKFIYASVFLVMLCFAIFNATDTTVFALSLGEDGGIETDPNGEDFDNPGSSDDTDSDDNNNNNTNNNNNSSISKISISGATVSSVKTKVYTGSYIKPSPVVKVEGVTLTKGTDYKLSYKNNRNTGQAVIIITGIGKYTGTKKVTFIIKPARVKILNIRTYKKGSLTVKWAKNAGNVSGYQVRYSRTKSFKKSANRYVYKTGTISKNKIKKTINNLKSGKTYYVKIRSYTKVNGKRVYGKFSKILRITIK
ncbi:MAG: fibronectin type III domain-containing protein [Eubacterium sp.]